MGTTTTTGTKSGKKKRSADRLAEHEKPKGPKKQTVDVGKEMRDAVDGAAAAAMADQGLNQLNLGAYAGGHFMTWARKRGLTGKVEQWVTAHNGAVQLHNTYEQNMAGLLGLSRASGVDWKDTASLAAEFEQMQYSTIDNGGEEAKGRVTESIDGSAELHDLSAAIERLKGAKHSMEEAQAGVEEWEQNQRKKKAEAGKADIESRIEQTIAPMKTVESLIFKAAGAYAGRATTVASAVGMADTKATMPGETKMKDPGESIDLTSKDKGKAKTFSEWSDMPMPSDAVEWLVEDHYKEQLEQLDEQIAAAQKRIDDAVAIQVKAHYAAASSQVKEAATLLQAASAKVQEEKKKRAAAFHSLGRLTDRNRVEDGDTRHTPFDEMADHIAPGGLARAQTLMKIANMVMKVHDLIVALDMALDGSIGGKEVWDMVCGDVPVMTQTSLQQGEDGEVTASRTDLDDTSTELAEHMTVYDQLKEVVPGKRAQWAQHKAAWMQLLDEWVPGIAS